MFWNKNKKKRKVHPFANRAKIKKELRSSSKIVKQNNRKNLLKRLHRKPNFILITLTTLFLIGGLLMIFSSSAVLSYNYHKGDTFYFFKRQIVFIIFGIGFAYLFYIMPLTFLRKISTILLASAIVLMLYILPEALFHVDMPLVKTINGATRWIDLKFFDLQPAELIKFAFIIYLSAWLTKPKDAFVKLKNKYSNHFVNIMLPFLILLGMISLLVLAQKDLDTTMILVLSVLAVYYSADEDRIHAVGSVFILSISFVFGILLSLVADYRKRRLFSFLDIFWNGQPQTADKLGDSFQVWNGLVAIGSGGLLGLGYGESRAKLFYLQEAAFTDSIFAVIGEEFGFVGAVLVIIGFLYFASIGFNIARRAPDKFSSLLATGMTSWIIIQAFLNIAANLSVIPFGGMPLPFLSYGGSSTITILMAVGVLLNVSKRSTTKY